MNGRRLARWAVRATVIGAFLSGLVYVAGEANAGAIWNLAPEHSVDQPAQQNAPGSGAPAVDGH
jgi:hypothetical protein